MKNAEREIRLNRIFSDVMLLVAAICLFFILKSTISALFSLGDTFNVLKNTEISEEEMSFLSYDDGIFASLAFACTDTDVTMAEYLERSLRAFFERILSVGVVYSAVVASFFVYPMAMMFGEKKKKHYASLSIITLALYVIFVAVAAVSFAAKKMPVYAPSGSMLLALIVSLFSAVAGISALTVWLRNVEGKKSLALFTAIVMMILYILSAFFEVVIFGTENYSLLIKNIGVLYEFVVPCSGYGLALISHGAELNVPAVVDILYIVKAVLWITLPYFINRKTKENA